MRIDVRRWVAVWYRCPKCGSQTADPMLTPYRYRHLRKPTCFGLKCDHCEPEIVERRWYTTFCIEPGVSFTTIAGTLEKIGPFKLCDIVHRNHREFRKWYRQRRREVDEQARQYFEAYFERQRQIEALANRNTVFSK